MGNLTLGLALVLVAAPLEGQTAVPPAQQPLFLTHITVVDVTGGHSKPDMTVVIAGERITSIVSSVGASVPRGAKVVNAAGKYLIPGLWDMHVHLTEAPGEGEEGKPPAKVDARAYYFPLLVANGVLGARDMGGVLDTLISWRKEIAAGKTLGPRLMVTGFKLGSANPVVPGAAAPVETAAQVHTSVELLRQHGADFVKVDFGLENADLYPVVAEESKRQGLTFVGHVPLSRNRLNSAAALTLS